MTATATPTATSPGRRRWSRRQRRGAVVLVVILALGVVGALTMRHLDGRYGPIVRGDFSGPVNVDQLATSNGTTGSLRAGSSAPVQLMTSMANNGSHAVTVTSVDYSQFQAAVSSMRWSTWQAAPGGLVSGVNTPWHAFPATIPKSSMIRLLITVHRPADCAAYLRRVPAGTYDGSVTVHWKSLVHDHVTHLSGLTESIKVC